MLSPLYLSLIDTGTLTALTCKSCPLLPRHGGDPGRDDEGLWVPQTEGDGHDQPQHRRHVDEDWAGHGAAPGH